MRMLSLALMLTGWLLYGAMPAMSAFPAPVMSAAGSGEHAGHIMPDSEKNAGHDRASDAGGDTHSTEPCPHRGGGKHVPFCAACLVLPPSIDIAASGMPAFSQVPPQAMQALVAGMPAPPERPPRS